MGRPVALAVGAVLVLLAAGCGGADDAADGGDSADVRVALVTDIGGLNDRGFNALANDGLERAKEELGRRRPGVHLRRRERLRPEPLPGGP